MGFAYAQPILRATVACLPDWTVSLERFEYSDWGDRSHCELGDLRRKEAPVWTYVQ
jgi:hypothetical protein